MIEYIKEFKLFLFKMVKNLVYDYLKCVEICMVDDSVEIVVVLESVISGVEDEMFYNNVI